MDEETEPNTYPIDQSPQHAAMLYALAAWEVNHAADAPAALESSPQLKPSQT